MAALSKARKSLWVGRVAPPRCASMWPRFRKRGNTARGEVEAAVIHASMWPRFRKRGNRPAPGSSSRPWQLQCGRAFESAEIQPGHRHGGERDRASMWPRFRKRGNPTFQVRADVAVHRFNVAALSKARKCLDAARQSEVLGASMWPRFRKRGNSALRGFSAPTASLQCGRAFESAEIEGVLRRV